MATVGYVLLDREAGTEYVMGNLDMAIRVVRGEYDEPLIQPSIDEAIAMERRRGMPDHLSRTNGLHFYRITVEKVDA